MKLDSKYFDCVRVKPDHEQAVRRGGAGLPVEGLQRRGRSTAPPGAAGRRASTTCSASSTCAQFNASYNYFDGMSNADIEAYQKDSVTGHRPTWKVGANSWAHGTRDGMGTRRRIRPALLAIRTSSSPGARPDPGETRGGP